MTQITAYTYEADYHCVQCTQKLRHWGVFEARDEHGVPTDVRERKGSITHPVFSSGSCTEPVVATLMRPVFSTDELPTTLRESPDDGGQKWETHEFTACGTCRKVFSLLTGETKCI